MKIFKIENDSNHIQSLLPINNQFYDDSYKFEALTIADNWKFYDMYVSNPKTKVQNFYCIGTSSALVFDEKTLEICRTVFEMSGEILPIQVERGPKLYLLNVLECMNGLDYDKTIWDYYDDGTKGRILKYAFHEDRIQNESTIFKIPETSKTDIFCFSDVKDRPDEFYHLYHDNNLTGLIFEEIL